MAFLVLADHYLVAVIHRCYAGTAKFKYFIFAYNFEKTVYLGGLSSQLADDARWGKVDYAGLVNIADVAYSGALAFVGADLDKQQLAQNRFVFILEPDSLNLDHFFSLKDYLLDDSVVPLCRNGDARYHRVVRLRNGKRVDVVTALAEKHGYACENVRVVFNEHCYDSLFAVHNYILPL